MEYLWKTGLLPQYHLAIAKEEYLEK